MSDPNHPADPDATQAMPAVAADEPPPPGGPPPGAPPGYGPDRPEWLPWAIGAVGVLIVLLIAFLVLDNGDDDTNVVASTTSSSTTSTTEERQTSTTAQRAATSAPATTAAPSSSTIPRSRCTGRTSATNPEAPARTLHDSWRISDRDCAETVADKKVVDELFDLEPNGPAWTFQGCNEEADPDPHYDCAFTYEGGSAHFLLNYGAKDGWRVYDIEFVAD